MAGNTWQQRRGFTPFPALSWVGSRAGQWCIPCWTSLMKRRSCPPPLWCPWSAQLWAVLQHPVPHRLLLWSPYNLSALSFAEPFTGCLCHHSNPLTLANLNLVSGLYPKLRLLYGIFLNLSISNVFPEKSPHSLITVLSSLPLMYLYILVSPQKPWRALKNQDYAIHLPHPMTSRIHDITLIFI